MKIYEDKESKEEFGMELSDAYKRIRKEFENAPDYIKEYYNNNFATSKHAKKLTLKNEAPDVSLVRKINLDLSENEYRALEIILDHGISVCSGGCIYEEMQETQVICDDCDFTKARNTLEVLFGLIGDEYL